MGDQGYLLSGEEGRCPEKLKRLGERLRAATKEVTGVVWREGELEKLKRLLYEKSIQKRSRVLFNSLVGEGFPTQKSRWIVCSLFHLPSEKKIEWSIWKNKHFLGEIPCLWDFPWIFTGKRIDLCVLRARLCPALTRYLMVGKSTRSRLPLHTPYRRWTKSDSSTPLSTSTVWG